MIPSAAINFYKDVLTLNPAPILTLSIKYQGGLHEDYLIVSVDPDRQEMYVRRKDGIMNLIGTLDAVHVTASIKFPHLKPYLYIVDCAANNGTPPDLTTWVELSINITKWDAKGQDYPYGSTMRDWT